MPKEDATDVHGCVRDRGIVADGGGERKGPLTTNPAAKAGPWGKGRVGRP